MQLLEFSTLATIPHLKHVLTTREGGVSSGPYASLNLAFHVGDEAEAARENRRRLAGELGFDIARLVAAQQVHGNVVGILTSADAGRGALNGESAVAGVDALVTTETGLPLLMMVADCAPIVLADPDKRVLAVVHAGWRGALAGIAGRAVRAMGEQFGCEPSAIRGGIGPCLCTANLEVGEEVASQVAAVFPESVMRRPEWAKPHLDLRDMIGSDLERAGVAREAIEVSPLCPQIENALLFSHRGGQGVAGRFGIVAWWE